MIIMSLAVLSRYPSVIINKLFFNVDQTSKTYSTWFVDCHYNEGKYALYIGHGAINVKEYDLLFETKQGLIYVPKNPGTGIEAIYSIPLISDYTYLMLKYQIVPNGFYYSELAKLIIHNPPRLNNAEHYLSQLKGDIDLSYDARAKELKYSTCTERRAILQKLQSENCVIVDVYDNRIRYLD